MADTYPRSAIPEPYQREVRRELRKLPTWKLQEAYGKLKGGESTGVELMERNRAYALSAIEEALWERGKLPTSGSHSSGAALITTVFLGVGVLSAVLGTLALTRSLRQRVYSQNGQYLVAVRYPGQWHDLRDFIQPSNADVLAVYYGIGPDSWALYDFVCRNIDYRRDIGEFWQTPSETLKGYADCEDTSILLTSLLRNFTNAHVALGSFQGFGHAWVTEGGQIYETTYIRARPVSDPQDYCPYVCFNDQEVVELWPDALAEVFDLNRNEATKLNLIAQALGD